MTSEYRFVGVHVSYGRRPFTIALLDDGLDLIMLENHDMKEVSAVLSDLDRMTVSVTEFSRSRRANSFDIHRTFYEELKKISFQRYPAPGEARQWFKIDADEVFRSLLQHKLLARRALEGRLQRALILYDRGLQIGDPMEFFEEITRYKLLQGILPHENLYSSKELDALVAAFVAWMTVNRPEQIERSTDNMVLLKKRMAQEPQLTMNPEESRDSS